jgi:transcriptional regulator with XRE-family HTH domain
MLGLAQVVNLVMEDNMIGRYLKELRKKKGLSQQDLANLLNVSKQTVSNWEVGRKAPRMKAVSKMAKLFDVPKASIMAGLPAETVLQANKEWDKYQVDKVIEISDGNLKFTYKGYKVPKEYINMLEKLMRCDIADEA